MTVKQECIPVGCVPAVCCSLLPGGGGSAWSRGGSPCQGGVCLVQGGFSLLGGFSLPGGSAWFWGGLGGLPGEPPPWTESQTRVKNITLATTSLRPVTRMHSSRMRTAQAHQAPPARDHAPPPSPSGPCTLPPNHAHTPPGTMHPPRLTESQTPVKNITLPQTSFTGGKNTLDP